MTGGSATAEVQAGAASAPAPRVRLDWLDALKGVGIIAVVAGHIWTRGLPRDVLFSFHMPLFFMTSGAVSRHVPFRLLLPRLGWMLAVPFLCFSVLLLGADFLIEAFRGHRTVFPDAATGLSHILLSTQTLRGPFSVLWFVPCLFAARLIWNALLGRLRRVDGLAMLAVMIVIGALALAIDRYGGASPLGLIAVPAALLFIWAGALWRDWRPGPLTGLAVAAVAIAAFVWLPPLNMRAGELGWPLLSLAAAIAIVDRIAWAVRLLPLLPMTVLAWLGRNSLVIMFLHTAFIHYLWDYLGKATLFAVALSGSLAIALLARRTRLSRRLLLGER